MQPGVRRLFFFRFGSVLSGLVFAGLFPVGPAIAGEVGAGGSAVPWHRLPADDGEAGFRQSPTDFRSLAGVEFVLREADEGAPSRDLFFRAGDRLRIGARGGFDFGSGDLRAIVLFKVDF